MGRHLVLLETSGNQRYIFATNKLRENVGASELTLKAGREWVPDALKTIRGTEVVLATSGKAYVLAESETAAAAVITAVTRRALKEAPGLDLSGVFIEVNGNDLNTAIQAAHKLLAARRGMNPGVEARFRRLPVVAECATSGLPATAYEHSKREPGARSAQSTAKRNSSGSGIARMRRIAQKHANLGIVYSVADLDRDADADPDELETVAGRNWLAVVHADGNGLGQVFLNFNDHVPKGSDYAATLRKFSEALDTCTEKAFGHALKQLHTRCKLDPLPVVPIVLGGDDMTVVMDGRFAIQFTIDFLAAFESLTAADRLIPVIMKGLRGTGPDRVTACAGVAVVKPHFPFYAAYELAEELIRSAKRYAKSFDEKAPLSAVDFHILYDASGADLERIREALKVDGGATELIARPYLISEDKKHRRTTAALADRMTAVLRRADGRRLIPNSQLHDLRTALFMGRVAATARYGLMSPRYPALKDLLPDGLFWDDSGVHRTHLLDAIDLAEFWHDGEDQ